MAITNYTSLAAALPQWLDCATADISSVVSDIITNGEKRIFREVRTPEMEASLSSAISSGTISVPSDYVELKYAYIDTNPVQYVQLVPVSYIYERYPTRSADGVPVVMARDGSNFIFGPYPDSNYTVKGTYYKRLAAIGDTTTPALISSNPDLYLYAALLETEPLLGRDQRLQLWEAKYRMVKEMINGEADRSRFGGNLSIRPG
jgi:hypothetical protein